MQSDVCLILEGTYPYVLGGVSTWVAQILEHMPHLSFSILFIGPKHDMPRSLKYKIPPNVTEIKEVFLLDYPDASEFSESKGRLTEIEQLVIWGLIKDCAQGKAADLKSVGEVLKRFKNADELFAGYDRDLNSWDEFVYMYKLLAPPGISFRDFFWTNRFISLPLLNILMKDIPKAWVYHSACTGYAGILGAKAAVESGRSFILTEHGIYNRERRIEIFSADWIGGWKDSGFFDMKRMEHYFKRWWSQFFDSLSRTAYESAEHITTLFEDNRRAQIDGGADAEKTMIIPNGIKVNQFLKITPRRRTASDPFHIGFIGRITEIKDIKTLLKSLGILKSKGVNFKAWLLGPMDEEPEYARECIQLSHILGIADRTEFTGRVKIMDYLHNLDVVVLTSISEAQPFVIIEANCAGVPVVTTDVGAAKEMVNGRDGHDAWIGRGGLVTSVATPLETAEAFEIFAAHPDMAARYGDNGRKRAVQYYNIRDVMRQYQDLYESHLYAAEEH